MKKISILMATVFVDMLGFAMVFPLLPYYALRLEAQEWQIGWMIASYSIAQIIAAPLWGRISDRYGRRPAIIIGLLSSAIAFLVFGLATSIGMLFLSRIVQGAGGGTAGVAQAYVGDAIAPEHRAKSLGWLSAASSAGVMLGPAIGSLSTRLGPEAPGFIAAGLCLLNVIFAWFWLPEPERNDVQGDGSATTDRRPLATALWDVLRSPGTEVSQLVWVYAIGMLGFMSTTAVLALFLHARFGITEETVGIVFLYVGGLSLLMRGAVLEQLFKRYSEVAVMRVGAAALAIGLLALPLPASVVGFAAVLALMPIGTACLFPATTALVTQRAPVGERGQVLGVQQAFGGVARVLAPIWATAAYQTIGHGVPFFGAAAVVGLAGLITLRVRAADPATASTAEPAPAQ